MGLLEDLLEGTSAVADTLDKGSQALRQGQEGLEYTHVSFPPRFD